MRCLDPPLSVEYKRLAMVMMFVKVEVVYIADFRLREPSPANLYVVFYSNIVEQNCNDLISVNNTIR